MQGRVVGAKSILWVFGRISGGLISVRSIRRDGDEVVPSDRSSWFRQSVDMAMLLELPPCHGGIGLT